MVTHIIMTRLDSSSPFRFLYQWMISTTAYYLKQAYSRNAKMRTESSSTETTTKKSKVKRLSNMQVSEFFLKNNIQKETELMAVTKQRYEH